MVLPPDPMGPAAVVLRPTRPDADGTEAPGAQPCNDKGEKAKFVPRASRRRPRGIGPTCRARRPAPRPRDPGAATFASLSWLAPPAWVPSPPAPRALPDGQLQTPLPALAPAPAPPPA